jgi:hypothetical protein
MDQSGWQKNRTHAPSINPWGVGEFPLVKNGKFKKGQSPAGDRIVARRIADNEFR